MTQSCSHMDVSENRGTPKSSILIGFSIINHPFWGTPIFGNPRIVSLFPIVSVFKVTEKLYNKSGHIYHNKYHRSHLVAGHIWKNPCTCWDMWNLAHDSMFKNKYIIKKHLPYMPYISIYLSTGCRISSQLIFHRSILQTKHTLPRRLPWQLPGMPWYCPHCEGVSSRP